MTEGERLRWDAKHSTGDDGNGSGDPGIPQAFAPYADVFPTSGFALDLACGRGTTSVWLASLGLDVCGIDISPVALEKARRLAAKYELNDRCRFRLADLDLGLPSSPPADLVVCHMFRDPRLYRPIIERLKYGGLLAIAVLSEIGDEPGPFRAGAGELKGAFGALNVIAFGEGEGRAWLIARK